jgi:hypothetical protein
MSPVGAFSGVSIDSIRTFMRMFGVSPSEMSTSRFSRIVSSVMPRGVQKTLSAMCPTPCTVTMAQD